MILALLWVAIAAAPADRFDRATELVAEGRHADAAADLESLAADHPESAQAPEALFLAASLREERLDQPAAAAALYRRIVERYPDSRVAIAAGRRHAALAPMLGDRPEALAAFVSIRRRLPELGAVRALAEAEALLAEHDEWEGAAQVRLWMAGVAERDGDSARAARLYQAVLASDAGEDLRFEAGLGAAFLAIGRGDYDRAGAALDALPATDNPGRLEALRSARARLERARTRAGVNLVAIAVLIAGPLFFIGSLRQAAGSWAAACRQLSRPPAEAIYLAPLVAVFVIGGFTDHHAVAWAIAEIAVAGVAVAWLSGAGLRAGGRWRPITHAAVAGITVIAACYVALHAGDLLDLIVSTVRLGPDV